MNKGFLGLPRPFGITPLKKRRGGGHSWDWADISDICNEPRVMMLDYNRHYVLAWYGGHGVHVYDEYGREVSFFNVGDFSKNDADEDEVRDSMNDMIVDGEYP